MSAARLLPRALRLLAPLRAPVRAGAPAALRILPRSAFRTPAAVRFNSTKILTYEAVTALKPNQILVDVREPGEFAAGAIPGAINLPLMSAPDALVLPEDEFEDRFGFAKPPKDADLVFYCKAGVRSASAAQIAVQQGYTHVSEYPGSWNEWVKRTNEAAK